MYPPESAEWIGRRLLNNLWLPQAAILVAFETSRDERGVRLWAWWEVFASHHIPLGAEDRRPLLLCTEVYSSWRLDAMDIPDAAWPLRDAAWGRWP